MMNTINLAVLLSFIVVSSIFVCKGDTNQDLSFIPTVNQTKCSGQTICNDVANYPKEYIEQLLNEQNITQNYPFFSTGDAVASRFNIMYEGNTLCRSKKETLKPQAGWNEVKNNWFFLVNHGPYEQAIEVDICEDEYKSCGMTDNFPVRTGCKQKYIYRKMLAFDGNMEMKNVKLPSCCSCFYYKK